MHLLLLAGTATDSFQFDSFSSFRNRQRDDFHVSFLLLLLPLPLLAQEPPNLLTTYNPVLPAILQRRPWLVAGRALSTALPFLSWYTMTRFDNLTSVGGAPMPRQHGVAVAGSCARQCALLAV